MIYIGKRCTCTVTYMSFLKNIRWIKPKYIVWNVTYRKWIKVTIDSLTLLQNLKWMTSVKQKQNHMFMGNGFSPCLLIREILTSTLNLSTHRLKYLFPFQNCLVFIKENDFSQYNVHTDRFWGEGPKCLPLPDFFVCVGNHKTVKIIKSLKIVYT